MHKKEQAHALYMEGGYTQKEIAAIVSVSERTVYTWIHQFGWNKLRLAAVQAPAIIADNLCSQIVELQNAIASREPGKRYPSTQEAEVLRKLICAWEKMKKYPSLSQTTQVLETFRNYMRPVDKQFTKDLAAYTSRFLEAKSINGFAPYELEYGVEAASPVSPSYEEVAPADDPQEAEAIPCPDIHHCLHKGNCTHPHCHYLERHKPSFDAREVYKVPPMHYKLQPPEASGSDSSANNIIPLSPESRYTTDEVSAQAKPHTGV